MNDATAPVSRYQQNPFGLVYDGAITKNEPGVGERVWAKAE
jgi:hypothetical protein